MAKIEQFTSRWGLLLATLGMAVGAGNIWRFPRLAGQYGGAFLIPWAIFLILWSIPLIMVEFSIGKETRKGTIGAFSAFLGKKYAWMGGFVGICTMAIMFYYSVVTGWALKYFVAAVMGDLSGSVNHDEYWTTFTGSGIAPTVFHFIALSSAAAIIYQGVVNGIERANKILLPSLLALLTLGMVLSLTSEKAAEGLNYLFGFDNASLMDPVMWLEALSQSAWSTGAGWGLVLTYAVYMRAKEDVTLNAFITGFGNNSASLIAAIAIIPAIFSLSPTSADAVKALQAGNEGLGFIVIPQLFNQMPVSQILITLLIALFFLALFFAALSSLIALMELSTRMIMDFGLSRQKALFTVAGLTAVLGLPSAWNMTFFKNQDWVWGLGLIISGTFFAFAAIKKGTEQFRQKYLLAEHNDLKIGRWFNVLIQYLIPVAAIVLLSWWFWRYWDAEKWWSLFSPFSLGTCLWQWGGLILILKLFNKQISRWVTK